jgi:hypothetical protein
MSIYTVPHHRWSTVLGRISGWKMGEPVSVDVATAKNGSLVRVVTSRPLAALALTDGECVTVSVTDPPQIVEIDTPQRVCLEQEGENGNSVVRVDTAGGDRMIVLFDEPFVPGIMDDVP